MRSLPNSTKKRLSCVVAGGLVAFTACASDAPQDFINHPVGPAAVEADNLWNITFAIAAVIFFIVQGVLIFAIVRFRQRPGREASQFHGNTKVEVVLTVIPALILAGLAVPTVRSVFALAEEPDDAINVTVTARQFWWEYDYEDLDIVTANELHIPAGRPVFLTLEGDDVIHSFWVPRLGGAQDVVPGRTNTLTLEAPGPGTFLGQCKEYCGLSHANMRLRVIAQEPSDFQQWVSEQKQPAEDPADPAAQEGQRLFLEGQFPGGQCVNCHAIAGTDAQARTAPDLTHFASRGTFAGALFERTDENLRRWLADPPAVKPGALMQDYGLSADEIDALVAYLQSLE